ncbi:MAG: hypothetical protein LUH22_19215 [Bacteroides sp.]|nr:hypothetical protein [Bacteroides sp.]
MKKVILWGISLLIGLASCQKDIEEQSFRENGFAVKVVVDDVQTEVKTRASVPSEPGETSVNSLYLVFYKYKTDGSGAYIGYYKEASPLGMNSTIQVNALTSGDPLIYDEDYAILAFANLEDYVEDVNDMLEGMKIRTERAALDFTLLTAIGSGTNESENNSAIASSKLFMSARSIRQGKTSTATVNLIRGLARLDIYNNDTDHQMVSVSIWGASTTTTLWADGNGIIPQQMQRFYGVKDVIANEVKGKLYAFENKVAEPAMGDEVTTCLIIGMTPVDNPDDVSYYRVNVCPEDGAQNLIRNYCYKVTIRKVVSEGANTEYEAWTQSKNQLLISVNDWNFDDNGMIITDGTNVLGLPVKRIKLDPLGDVREYSIYTSGNGILQISQFDLPDGIKVVLEGNLLRVTADPLPAGREVTRGSIELTFAGLRGNIDIIQEPNDEKIFYLDRNTIANFSPVGRYGMTDGPLTVTSSGPWKAEIFNIDEDPDNPGFSFNPSGEAVTVLHSETNPFKNQFQIYTTGDNPDANNVRSGFIIVSLNEDPENYSVAIPLVQDVKPVFEMIPIATELKFFADGSPVNTAIAKGDLYEFTVNTGGIDWTVSMDGGDANGFVVTKVNARVFTIKAKAPNATVSQLKSTLKIAAGENVMEIPVSQDAAVITASFSGQIPAQGGEITVFVTSSSLNWDAKITKNWDSGANKSHEAYLKTASGNDRVTEITNQSPNGSFKVGFDALDYPLVNKSPVVKIEVSLNGLPTVSQTIEIVQLPMKPTSLLIMDVRHSSFGSLKNSEYFDGYNEFLRNKLLFGEGGKVPLPPISITEISSGSEPGVISSAYRYLHAGGRPERYTDDRYQSVENWRVANDGVVVFVCDDVGDKMNNPYSSLHKLGYRPASRKGEPVRIYTDLLNSTHVLSKNIMRYLLQDGPFGTVNNAGSLSFKMDNISTSLSAYPKNAVPVMMNADNNPLLVIDPDNRLVYIGEGQSFHSGYNVSIKNDKDRFLGNLISYVLNAALNGSAFTNIFKDDELYNATYGK